LCLYRIYEKATVVPSGDAIQGLTETRSHSYLLPAEVDRRDRLDTLAWDVGDLVSHQDLIAYA
jgi:hypothetical protein